MTLLIDLPPELQSQLKEEADKLGMSISEYARTLLESRSRTAEPSKGVRVPPKPSDASGVESRREQIRLYEAATPEEWEKAFDIWIEKHGKRGVALPSEALRREHMYGDRG